MWLLAHTWVLGHGKIWKGDRVAWTARHGSSHNDVWQRSVTEIFPTDGKYRKQGTKQGKNGWKLAGPESDIRSSENGWLSSNKLLRSGGVGGQITKLWLSKLYYVLMLHCPSCGYHLPKKEVCEYRPRKIPFVFSCPHNAPCASISCERNRSRFFIFSFRRRVPSSKSLICKSWLRIVGRQLEIYQAVKRPYFRTMFRGFVRASGLVYCRVYFTAFWALNFCGDARIFLSYWSPQGTEVDMVDTRSWIVRHSHTVETI